MKPARYDRRTFVHRSLAAATALVLPASALAATRGHRGFRVSLSVSPFTEEVLARLALSDGRHVAHTVSEVQQLFARHGATEVYARIATRRHAPQGGGEIGWARGLQRARLARDLGLPFNPELGLFAIYGDAGNYQQPPDFSAYPAIRLPGPWLSLTLPEMTRALRHYGALVAHQILATGVRVDIWDIGNEVEFGIAGVTPRPLSAGAYRAPDRVDRAIGQMSVTTLITMPEAERIAWLRAHLWPHVGRLLAATASGIASVHPAARFSTHISGLFEPGSAVALAFWSEMERAGFHAHVLGTSFYPSSGPLEGPGDRFAWLRRTASALSARFHRQLFIAEGGYPSGRLAGPYPFDTPLPDYPLDPAGQSRFLHDLLAWGARSGRLAGFRPWAPDLCLAGGWQPMSLFTPHGRVAHAKPALRAIRSGLAAA